MYPGRITKAPVGKPAGAFSLRAYALIRAQKVLDKLEGANEDQTVGIRILSRSIEGPLRQIVENAGEDAAVVLNAGRLT